MAGATVVVMGEGKALEAVVREGYQEAAAQAVVRADG